MPKTIDLMTQLPRGKMQPRLAAVGFAAFVLGTIPGSTPNSSAPPEPTGCDPSDDIVITEKIDSFELALAAFPCATEAVVVADSSSDQVLRSSVELATASNAPLFVSSPENEAELDATIERLELTVLSGETSSPTLTKAAFEASLRSSKSDTTYVLPASPTADQMAAVPSLAAIGIDIMFAEPGNEQQLGTIDPREQILFSSDFSPTDRWLAQRRQPLPGGGFRLFPERRIVALYGHPQAPVLGLLGEQDPQATVGRLSAMLPAYEAAGVPTIGGFEIISTIATADPGEDGNYSREIDIETIRPWVEIATENDLYVILDLQPGRTDFLTQARLYEEFLKLPNVGLALDPEWRLGPDQYHLRQIGGVDAAEVNGVVDYLAELVRANDLPQKALILHQFQTAMLPDRAMINTPPELAVVVHVDGQGPLGSKYGTWDRMRSDPIGANQTLWWAWKNFIDEDTPTASPEQVNDVQPLPVIVTYQ